MEKGKLKGPVLVTGGSGYIGSWIVKTFLDKGFLVRATVRDASREDKVAHLKALEGKGEVELHEADLMKPGSFKAAMEGCKYVIHAASPFFIGKIKDPKAQIIQPAIEGTRNVLESANETPSVEKVVLTSSGYGIFGDAVEMKSNPRGAFNEADWNQSHTPDYEPYGYSKVAAEKEAWKIAEAQDRWELIVVNPGFVMGPSLSKRVDGASTSFLLNYLNGQFRMGVPKLYFPMVDVRDVAMGHYRAAAFKTAKGRHLLVADVKQTLEIAKILKGKYGKQFKLPKRNLPKFMVWLLGPTQGFSRKFVSRNVGIEVKFENRKSREMLAMNYRNLKDTVVDHAEQLIEDGLVK